jgi:hypothetical protein
MKSASTPLVLLALAYLLLGSAIAQEDPSQIDDDAGPDFQPGDPMSNVYAMIAEAPNNKKDCRAILASLNTTKIFTEPDDWRMLVGTKFNYVWQRSADGKDWSDTEPTGDVYSSYYIDRLIIDVDGDGRPETLLRTPNIIQSQKYSQLYVEAPGDADALNFAAHHEISVKDVEPQAPLQIRPHTISGDFYALDVLHIQNRNYIIAGDAINPHGENRLPNVFIFTVGPSLTLNVVCYIKATKHF